MTDRSFPIFTVADLAAVRAFYERLGFEQTYQFPPDGEPGFVTMQRSGATIGVSRSSADGAPTAVGYWVYVDDVDATLAALCADGTEVVEEAVDQPWGERVAAVRDPAGTVVHLGAPTAPGGACPRPSTG